MSLSRGAAIPAAASAVWTRPEQSIPSRRPPAPEIGRLEEALGDRDEVRLARAELRQMARPEMQAVPGHRELAVPSHDRQPRPERQRHARRKLDPRSRIGVRAQRRHFVGRRNGRPERGERQVADIKVAVELRPGPALGIVVDRHALAMERLRFERRVRLRSAPQGRARLDDLHRAPFRVARRLDLAPKMRGCEIGAGRSETAIELGEGHAHSLVAAKTQPRQCAFGFRRQASQASAR